MDFDDWFYELQGFSFRAEHFWCDFDARNQPAMIEWLQTAYEMGYNASEAKFYGGTNA